MTLYCWLAIRGANATTTANIINTDPSHRNINPRMTG